MAEKEYAGLGYEMAVRKFSDTVTRICAVRCGNVEDTKDCYQNVFLKLYLSEVKFESEEHLKSWLIKVAITTSVDYVKQFWKRKVFLYDDASSQNLIETLRVHYDIEETVTNNHDEQVMLAVIRLPIKYRQVIFLYYYEEYSVSEVAVMLERSEGTVKSQLSRGRKILQKELKKMNIGGVEYEEVV